MQIAHIVFYGTLMSNGNTKLHAKIKEGMKHKGQCFFKELLYDLGRYPGLKEGDNLIQGELYELKDDNLLAELDAYESYDSQDPSILGFVRKPLNLIEPNIKCVGIFLQGRYYR